MPAAVLRKSHSEYNLDGIADPVLRIGDFGNYRREDFIFPRTQSRTMREAPWAKRLQPRRTWGEIIGAGLVFGIAGCVLMLSSVHI